MNRTFAMSALKALSIAVLISGCSAVNAHNNNPRFRVIAFYTANEHQAHISFVNEARSWFPQMAAKYNFIYKTTSNMQNLNSDFLAKYQVIVFLDCRPELAEQRAAFKEYMDHGGSLDFPAGHRAKTKRDLAQRYYPRGSGPIRNRRCST